MSSRTSAAKEQNGSQTYLPRGAACVSCRRRKMKCDGCHPVCGQCDRAGRAEDCEYTSGQERSTVQILEDNISQLEARIQELQNPQSRAHTTPLVLSQPYNEGSTSNRSNIQDPPRQVAEQLIDGFLPYATEFGFFLHSKRFRSSIFQGYPIGHPSRPSPALIFAIYLLGIHFSPDTSAKGNESAYLERAIQEASTALSINHPNKTLHSIQAEVLLANYFFLNGRFIEGKYHVAVAVSTALSAGLHKIRSPQAGPASALHPPQDAIEEGERILGAWTVFNLDKAWAVALQSMPSFEYAEHALAPRIDTPWPLEMEDFEQARLPSNVRTSQTVSNFLNGVKTPDVGLSARAIESKAVVLWDRVNNLTSRQAALPPNHPDQSRLIVELNAIDRVIDGLKAIVPPPTQVSRIPNSEHLRRLSVAYSIIAAATIRLHAAFSQQNETSHRKKLSAAQNILDIAGCMRLRHLNRINPIIGSVWIEAAQAFFDEITLIRSARASNPHWPGPNGTPDEGQLLGTIRNAVAVMNGFTTDVPLLHFQVKKIQETYETF